MKKTEEKSGKTDFKATMSGLESTLETYLVGKAPSIPENIKEIIVKFSPWLTLIFFVLSLPAILFALGVGTILTPFSYLGGLRVGMSYTVGMIFTAAVLVIEAIAIPGLFKRSLSAWKLLFYASLLSGIQALISFNLGGLIIGMGLSLYVLFQVKSYYK